MLTLAIPTIGTTTDEFLEDAMLSAINAPKDIVTEILISDDSRSVEFLNKLTEYQSQDSRIKIITPKERQTEPGNFNYLLHNCINPWILYLSDDDIFYGDKLKEIKYLLNEDLAFISSDFDALYSSTNKLKNFNKNKTVRRKKGIRGIIENPPKVISTLISVKRLIEVGSWRDEDGYFMDIMTFIRLETRYETVYVSTVLGAYRWHDSNASSKANRYEGYALHLPYVISEGYKYLQDREDRKFFTFIVTSWSFPHMKLITRVINKLLSIFGFKVWIFE